MEQYHYLLKEALSGEISNDERTGAGTVGVYSRQSRWDLNDGFPLVTTKAMHWPSVIGELMWFLSGETNIKPLLENKVRIWTSDTLRHNLDTVVDSGLMTRSQIKMAQKDARYAREVISDENMPLEERKQKFKRLMAPANELLKTYENKILSDEDFAERAANTGPSYGPQWRGTNGALAIDQIAYVEDELRKGGSSRRMIVDSWNSLQMNEVALPWCHKSFQVHVSPETQKLSLDWEQRSCDTVLGVPFNIATYGVVAELLALTHGFDKGELIGSFKDLHVYLPHAPGAKEQLARKPLELPELLIKDKKDSITEYTKDDFELIGYNHHPKLENPTPMYGGFF